MRSSAVLACFAAADAQKILIAGDSWGTDIGGGSIVGESVFSRGLKRHSCPGSVKNIAVAGSTAAQWQDGRLMSKLQKQVAGKDYVWMTLMGNDALSDCPSCAKNKTKSAEECGDEFIAGVRTRMQTILDGIHAANPQTRVVGFGYDIMFGGLGCTAVTDTVFPQCYRDTSATKEEKTRCFNTQFVRLQTLWEELAETNDFVDAINILGVTQAYPAKEQDPDPKAAVGAPDLDQFGPAWAYPDTLACIHPSLGLTGTSGAMVVMEEFIRQYWGPQLGCAGNETIV